MNAQGPLPPEAVHRLYEACGPSRPGRHDFALLVTMFNCGLTLAEISSLRWVHVDWSRRWLRIAENARRPRFIPLNKKTVEALTAWKREAFKWPFVFGCWTEKGGWGERFLAGKRETRLRERLNHISQQANVPFVPEQASMTLVFQILNLSEEGREILSMVPQEKWHDIRLPVANMSPFSVADRHTGMALVARGFVPTPADYTQPPREDEMIRKGRILLDQVGAAL